MENIIYLTSHPDYEWHEEYTEYVEEFDYTEDIPF
jgi:hypothetical protein